MIPTTFLKNFFGFEQRLPPTSESVADKTRPSKLCLASRVNSYWMVDHSSLLSKSKSEEKTSGPSGISKGSSTNPVLRFVCLYALYSNHQRIEYLFTELLQACNPGRSSTGKLIYPFRP